MKRLSLLAVAMLVFASSAAAADWKVSVDDRYDSLYAQLKDNNSYQAHLAREFASVAVEEKMQHDIGVAKAFMDKAEEHAAQAGSMK
ncbi:MAG: hypothetical protein Q9M20_00710 [Mariprofundaceae bacterium]|nr:hypothetical protein [Mariprofundaceae bacterium]